MRKDIPQTTDHRLQTAKHGTQKNNLCSVFCVLCSEKGMVLIVSLLLLLVATVVGITALSTSTTKVMIAGNQRLSEMNFSSADGGTSVSALIMKNLSTYTIPAVDPIITDANFIDEAAQDADIADIQYPVGNPTTFVDIDYLYVVVKPGSTKEFACGYDSCPSYLSANAKLYRINSRSVGAAGSESEVGTLSTYVPPN
ncbi:MAG: PilX N-terminal domain-containing pilus assembly protein [Thermodesulfovibrionia bacterium]|nr:PilX N-terminal domain-containing pilus assembly protein [Thermodesulfovibrionia bacterium]